MLRESRVAIAPDGTRSVTERKPLAGAEVMRGFLATSPLVGHLGVLAESPEELRVGFRGLLRRDRGERPRGRAHGEAKSNDDRGPEEVVTEHFPPGEVRGSGRQTEYRPERPNNPGEVRTGLKNDLYAIFPRQ